MAKKQTRVQHLILQRDESGTYVACVNCGQRVAIDLAYNICGTCASVYDSEGWVIELIDGGEAAKAGR